MYISSGAKHIDTNRLQVILLEEEEENNSSKLRCA